MSRLVPRHGILRWRVQVASVFLLVHAEFVLEATLESGAGRGPDRRIVMLTFSPALSYFADPRDVLF